MERAYLSLHPAQLDVFTDQLINPESPHYNIGGYIRLKGTLNKEKFIETILSIPEVFDTFKLRFYLAADGPLCYPDNHFEVLNLPEVDCSNQTHPFSAASKWMQENMNLPFDVQGDTPLFENYLIKIADEEYCFYGKYHHLLTDGFGFIV